MKNDLDRDLSLSLEESAPQASHLDAAHLHAHDTRIHRQDRTYSARENWAHALSLGVYRALSVLVAVGVILVLLWGVMDLPAFGRETNPVENEVSERYLAQGLQEGGATNLVANMILDYRAFDTLGESNVLFTAATAVLLLLRGLQSREANHPLASAAPEAPADPILRAGARALCPVILLYGLYIILNGHLGPGGGFSGGAVMGAALILYREAYGPEKMGRFFSFRTYRAISFFALAFYALSKAYSFFTGANHLPSIISNGTPGAILSAGLILPLNIAVGFVVCCTMYGFFALFEKGEI
ncbi:MAG: hypothetical protein IJ153_05845 [Clostridia bacterium]|nr:hypothetical protein [Clostridia bacterium]